MRNEELTQLLAPVIADLGLECLGVEYSPSHGNSLVRVYIEAADRPVTVDDCEVVSRQVSASLDVHDPIQGRYTLEVSSPGLDRPLYTPEQFARFAGQTAKLEVNLPIDGRRRFQGPIRAVEGATILMEQDGVAVKIAHDNIHKAKLVPDFGEQAKKLNKGKKGKKQEVRVLTVAFQPNDKTLFHTHRFPVTVYVLEGAFTLEKEGQEPVAVKTGQAMLMPPHVRMTGYNKSGTELLKLIVFYVSDPDTPFLDAIH